MTRDVLPRQSGWQIVPGDCREVLATLDAGSVQTCVTSPPYFGLRDYGHDGQIGLEPTPDEFVAALVAVFREVRRVLADDGTVWLNLGDSYCAATSTARTSDRERARSGWDGPFKVPSLERREVSSQQGTDRRVLPGLKQKDLIGIPWAVAFALRADGWFLRSDIIWSKPNPMPESVTDRPTKAHEYLFLLSKTKTYFYDADAIREPHVDPASILRHRDTGRGDQGYAAASAGPNGSPQRNSNSGLGGDIEAGRNRRSVWTVATQPFPGAHFATFPPKLIEPCILAGCPEGGTVLDPFAGAGTTGMVALRHNRSFIGCELNEDYVRLARDRIIADSPLLNTHAEVADAA